MEGANNNEIVQMINYNVNVHIFNNTCNDISLLASIKPRGELCFDIWGKQGDMCKESS